MGAAQMGFVFVVLLMFVESLHHASHGPPPFRTREVWVGAPQEGFASNAAFSVAGIPPLCVRMVLLPLTREVNDCMVLGRKNFLGKGD